MNQLKSEIKITRCFRRAFLPISNSIAKVTRLFAILFHVSDMTFGAVSLFFPVFAMFSLILAEINVWIRRGSFMIKRKRWSLIENNTTYYYNEKLLILRILILKINSYQMHDFHISCFWMGIPCMPNTGSTYCFSSTAYPCNLCLCCNTIFHCCTHICVSSGIVLK